MLRFRPITSNDVAGSVTELFAVGQLIDDAMQPGHFFVAPELRLTWIAARAETIHWEIFRGRLVEANQTRLHKSFLSWHVIEENATEPTISVKLDVHEKHIHVTRGLLAYVWEGYDSGGGVIESREVVKWTRELVGTIRLEEFADLESVRDELICLIWQAIVGTSRLPLTSVEAPLPAFSFGQLHYLYQANSGSQACISWAEWLVRGLRAPSEWREIVKLVEFILRQAPPPEHHQLHKLLRAEWPYNARSRHAWRRAMQSLMRAMFNASSLSPYTGFVDAALTFQARYHCDLNPQVRQLCRHLTAYDLVTFHHRGANYPDALLLDTVLRRGLLNQGFLDFSQGTFRQMCLLRRQYEGHLVPDAPTSPGENARVLPSSSPRVPEQQLMLANRRQKQLFADAPLSALVADLARAGKHDNYNFRRKLQLSVQELQHLEERVEMGLGLFIDRPLGYAKQVGEPDLTPILAHEAFSPSIARRRWGELKKLCAELSIDVDASKLNALFASDDWSAGLPHTQLADCPRPVAALADVRKVADDFVILRTKPVGLAQLLRQLDLAPMLRNRYRIDFGNEAQTPRLCVQAFDGARQPVLALYDEQLRRRVELRVDMSQGYVTRAGVELPRAKVHVIAVWEDTDDPAELRLSDVD